MKTTFLTCCTLVAIVLAGMVAPQVAAQDNGDSVSGDERAGTAAAEYLLIPLSARTAALGSTLTGGLSNLSAVEALQANPAAMMVGTGTSAQFSRMEYVADIGVNAIGVAQRFGSNSIALTVSAWDYGEIPETTVDSPDITNVTYDAGSTVVGLSLARQFTDRIAAGFTVKALSESIDDMTGSAAAFDAGMTYVVGESGLRFGVSLKNFGTKMSFGGSGLTTTGSGGTPVNIDVLESELPSLLNFGASYTRQFEGDLSVTALANFRSLAYDQDEYALGLEAGYANLFYVRGGFQMSQEMDATFYEGWNAGAGLNLSLSGVDLSVDYAYRGTQYFSGVNLFTVGLSL